MGIDYSYGIELPPTPGQGEDGFDVHRLSASELRAIGEETWLGIREVALRVVDEFA